MAEPEAYLLECKCKMANQGMMSLSGQLKELIEDYAKWLKDNDLSPEDLDYAKIFRCSDLGWVASLVWEDGAVILQPRKVRGAVIGAPLRRALFYLKCEARARGIPI